MKKEEEKAILGEKAGCLLKYSSLFGDNPTKEELDKFRRKEEELYEETKAFSLKYGIYTKEELEKLEAYMKESKFDEDKKKGLETYLNEEIEVELHSLVGDESKIRGVLLKVKESLVRLDAYSEVFGFKGDKNFEYRKEPGKEPVYKINGVEVGEDEFLKEGLYSPFESETEIPAGWIKRAFLKEDNEVIYNWLR